MKKTILSLWIMFLWSFYILAPFVANACDVHLNVPFKAQVPPGTVNPDGSWPLTKNCGQTSSLMIFSYYNGTIPTEQNIWQINGWLAQKYNDPRYNAPAGDGWYTDINKLAALAREYGAFPNSHSQSGWTIDRLREELTNGFPVIIECYTNMSTAPGNIPHFMVLIGMDDENIYVNDPGHSLTSGKGKNYHYPISQFKNIWAIQGNRCVTIAKPTSLTLTGSPVAPPAVTPGQNVEILAIGLEFSINVPQSILPVTITQMILDLKHEENSDINWAEDNDIFLVKLLDIGGNVLSTGTFSNRTLVFPDVNYSFTQSISTVFTITIDVSPDAVPGRTICIRLANNSYIQLISDNPNSIPVIGMNPCPIESNLSTIIEIGPFCPIELQHSENRTIFLSRLNLHQTQTDCGLDFGAVDINTSVSKNFTIMNIGEDNILVSPQITGDSTDFVVSEILNPRISPGKYSQVTVTFTPTEVKQYSNTLTVNSHTGDPLIFVPLSGEGITDVELVTLALPTATKNQTYNFQLQSVHGKTPYVWEISRLLPYGLEFDSGVISGVPKEIGDFPLTITVKAADGSEASKNYTLTVSDSSTGVPRFLTLPLKTNARVVNGWYYSHPPNSIGVRHAGIDYEAFLDQHVVAAADGMAMVSSQYANGEGYGKFVFIRHNEKDSDGNYYFTLYAHLNRAAPHIKVYPSEQRWNTEYPQWTPVKRGEVIGYVGKEDTQWVHLHFEVQRGGYAQNKTDPYDLYKQTTADDNSADFYPPDGSQYSGSGSDYLWTTDPPSLAGTIANRLENTYIEVNSKAYLPSQISLRSGEVFHIVFEIKNIGDTDWQPFISGVGGYGLRLIGGDIPVFDGNGNPLKIVWIMNNPIRPNEPPWRAKIFAHAPSGDGTYTSRWQMFYDPGGHLFGKEMVVEVQVDNASIPLTPEEIRLIQKYNDKNVYLYRYGLKHYIPNEETLAAFQFEGSSLHTISPYSPDVVDAIPEGLNVFGEGFMFRIDGTSPIYLVQDGKARHYQNANSFLGRGYAFGDELIVAGSIPNEIINQGTGLDITQLYERDVSFSLWFEKDGVETDSFAPGEQVTIKAQVLGDGYMVYSYLRLDEKLYYYYSPNGFGPSSVKRPLFYNEQGHWLSIPIQTTPLQNQPIPWQAIENGTLILGEIRIPDNPTQSKFQWEFWCEDANQPYFPDKENSIRKVPHAQAIYSIEYRELTITQSRLEEAYHGQHYQVTLAADGGVPLYQWGLEDGILPDGLSLNTSSGEIAGNVAGEVGNYPIKVKVVDNVSAEDLQAFELHVVEDTTQPVVAERSPSSGAENVSLRPTITITFSEPMDKTTTENAFSTSPSFAKTLEWDASVQTLTVYPSEDLIPLVSYALSVSAAATDSAGNSLIATTWHFETRELVTQPSITGDFPTQIILQGEPVIIDLTSYEAGTGAGEGDEMTWEFISYDVGDPFILEFDSQTDILTLTPKPDVSDTESIFAQPRNIGRALSGERREIEIIVMSGNFEVFITRPSSEIPWVSGKTNRCIFYAQYDSEFISEIEQTFNIYLSSDTGQQFELIETVVKPVGAAVTGAFEYDVPLDMHSDNAQLKITVTDSLGNTAETINDFRIIDGTPPTLEIISPSEGTVWELGRVGEISWVAGGPYPISKVNIYFLIDRNDDDNPEYQTSIVTNLSGETDSYLWNIPKRSLYASDEVKIKVRVTDTNGTKTYSEPSRYVTITDTLISAPPPWSAKQQIGDFTSRYANVAVDTNGNHHIVWRTVENSIHYARFDGAVLSQQEELGTGDRPLIAVDAHNNPHVMWMDNGIKYRRKSGTWLAVETIFSGSLESYAEIPRLIVTPLNQIHVVWVVEEGGTELLEHRYKNAPDGGWSQTLRAITEPYEAHQPSVFSDAQGNLHVAYMDRLDTTTPETYYLKFDGSSWGIPTRVTNTERREEFYSAICVDSTGKIHIISTTEYSGDGEALEYTTSHNGSTWSPSQIIAEDWTDEIHPRLILDADDYLHLFWVRHTDNGDDLVYANHNRSHWSMPTLLREEIEVENCYPLSGTLRANREISVFFLDRIGGEDDNFLFYYTTQANSLVDPTDRVPPPAISDLSITVGNRQNSLSWNNPTTDWAKTVIRRSENEFPETLNDGELAYEGMDSSDTDTELANYQEYFYTVFAVDAGDNPSPMTDAMKISGMPYFPADVDKDEDVDVFDITKIAEVFGTPKGDERYSPLLDYNEDEQIDILDLIYWANFWGQSHPFEEPPPVAPVFVQMPTSPIATQLILEQTRITLNKPFTMRFAAETGISLQAFSFQLQFDPNQVEVLSHQLAGAFSRGYWNESIPLISKRQEKGTFVYGGLRPSKKSSSPGTVQTLAKFQIRPKKPGTITLHLNEIKLIDQTGRILPIIKSQSIQLEIVPKLPAVSKLLPNYPNPFNPETWIPYQIPEDAHVAISIYNVHGQLVRQLNLGFQPAGYYLSRLHAARWDGHNQKGESVSSGLYFYRINAGKFHAVRRMAIVK